MCPVREGGAGGATYAPVEGDALGGDEHGRRGGGRAAVAELQEVRRVARAARHRQEGLHALRADPLAVVRFHVYAHGTQLVQGRLATELNYSTLRYV